MKRLCFFVIFISFFSLNVIKAQAESKFLYNENNSLEITELKYSSKKIPKKFDGYRIVHLSDLHSKTFGEKQKVLYQNVKWLNPDLIVFTGDLVDQKNDNEEASLMFMKEISKIAPVFFVTGNHEWSSGRFISLEKKIINLGINVLRNSYKEVQLGDDKIYIIGIDDPAIEKTDEDKIVRDELKIAFQSLKKQKNFKILLSHRPEHFPKYAYLNADIIFSGHAHGDKLGYPLLGV